MRSAHGRSLCPSITGSDAWIDRACCVKSVIALAEFAVTVFFVDGSDPGHGATLPPRTRPESTSWSVSQWLEARDPASRRRPKPFPQSLPGSVGEVKAGGSVARIDAEARHTVSLVVPMRVDDRNGDLCRPFEETRDETLVELADDDRVILR